METPQQRFGLPFKFKDYSVHTREPVPEAGLFSAAPLKRGLTASEIKEVEASLPADVVLDSVCLSVARVEGFGRGLFLQQNRWPNGPVAFYSGRAAARHADVAGHEFLDLDRRVDLSVCTCFPCNLANLVNHASPTTLAAMRVKTRSKVHDKILTARNSPNTNIDELYNTTEFVASLPPQVRATVATGQPQHVGHEVVACLWPRNPGGRSRKGTQVLTDYGRTYWKGRHGECKAFGEKSRPLE